MDLEEFNCKVGPNVTIEPVCLYGHAQFCSFILADLACLFHITYPIANSSFTLLTWLVYSLSLIRSNRKIF